MTPSTVVAAVLAGLAVALVRPPLPRPGPVGATDLPVAEVRPGSTVRRLALALASGAAAALVVPGPVGAVAGVASAAVAWRWLGRLVPAAEVRRRRRLATELPVAVDLLASALRSGADPTGALAMVTEALPGPVADELAAVVRRLGLGADPGLVWRDLGGHAMLGPLGRALLRAHRSGSSVVIAADRLAVELREAQRAEVEARARSVSTRAAAPLGLCFLPAFVLLGIVPLVAGLLGSLR